MTFKSISVIIALSTWFSFMVLGNDLNAQNKLSIAEAYLQSNFKTHNLSEKDIENYIISDNYVSKHNGLNHIYLQQTYNGVPVENALININILSNGEVVSVNSRFISNIKEQAKGEIKISGLNAVENALLELQILKPERIEVVDNGKGSRRYSQYKKFNNLDKDITSQLTYLVEDSGRVSLVWETEIHTITPRFDAWKIYVDASTGEILKKVNMVLECTFENQDRTCHFYNSHKDHFHKPIAKPKEVTTVDHLMTGGTYLVFDSPTESPNHGGRTVVVDPADPVASPYGWHDYDGIAGAEYTTTRGNNVWAQDDMNGNNGTNGFSPDGGALLNFQYNLDFNSLPWDTIDPVKNLHSSLTNLFYWNNIIHDITYQYGFDEPSGNFQQNNYGRGGEGGDFIYADGLDGSDSNNARFYTSADGLIGRMEMYLWGESEVITTFDVNSPGGIAGPYDHASANFGPTTFNVTGDLVIADDGNGTTSDACTALTNGSGINGNIALIDRGSCEFSLKVLNAQNEGAIAVIICNNVAGPPVTMGAGANGGLVTIPSIMLSQSDCNTIRMQIPTVNVTFTGSPDPSLVDGSYDNGIIAHEYAHGISNRLTGGPGTSGCLGNVEQGGEGWSDFFGLVLTHEAGDDRNTSRGIGTYAIGQGTGGGGIRTYPYTTDMGINPFTYDDIKTQSIPHGVGSVLCTMLWDMYWDLVDLYGYDPDLYSGTGGNNIAIQLVMDGLKLQPCSPGFTDVRDAILLADEINYGGANRCLIWNAFARRGLGLNADQGSTNDRSDGIEAYDLPDDLKIDESISLSDAYEGEVLNISTSVTCGCTTKNNVEYKHIIPDGLSVVSVLQGSLSGNEISRTTSSLSAGSTLDIEYDARIDLCNPNTVSVLVEEGAEGTNSFSSSTITSSGNWITSTSESNTGSNSWYAEDYAISSDYGLSLVTPITISGPTLLEFYHKYETESTWDGGVVEVFSNGIWNDMGDNFIMNGYPTSFASNGSSPLAGRDGFTGSSNPQLGTGFVKSIVDLSGFNGETINIRFRFATDSNTPGSGLNGWYIDDIKIRQIPAVEINTTVSSEVILEDSRSYLIEIKDLNQSKIYVDESTTGARYGGDWTNAFNSLQDALTIAECNDSVTEIWVKQGDYLPTDGSDRSISFELLEGVAVYGGFNGTETLLSQRNVSNNVTTLSGNIGIAGDDTDNSYHVVKAENLNNTAILDGFTIKNGYSASTDGAGLINSNSSATFSNCTFTSNFSSQNGGAVSNENGSSSTFTDCVFQSNSCTGTGGAIINKGSSSIILQESLFNSNTSNSGTGRAIHNHFSVMTIDNVIIVDPLLNSSGNTVNNQGEVGKITVLGNTEIKQN